MFICDERKDGEEIKEMKKKERDMKESGKYNFSVEMKDILNERKENDVVSNKIKI